MSLLKKTIKQFIPYFVAYQKLKKAKVPASYGKYVKFKLGLYKMYWPKDKTCLVANPRKIFVGKNCLIGRPGTYIQGAGTVVFGDYVQLAPNVGILSSNHDLYDQNKYIKKPIRIGDYSWIGMNSIVLAGVELGTRTVVAAGSVVTKSFPDGFCVVAGNPAKIIKQLDKDIFHPWHYEMEFHGFIPKEKFEKVKSKYIDI